MREDDVADEPQPKPPADPPQEITSAGGLTIRKPGTGNGQ
jgi:hypothetical protein